MSQDPSELMAENERLRRRIADLERRQNTIYLDTLHETLETFLRHTDLNEMLKTILHRAAHIMQADGGYIFLQGAQPDEIEHRASFGIFMPYLNASLKIGSGVAGQVWSTGRKIIITDYNNYPHRLANVEHDSIHTLACFPMQANGVMCGVMGVAFQSPERQLGEKDLNILESFARLATIAVESAYSQDALRSSRSLVEQITEIMPGILFIHDININQLTYLNPAFSRILGYAVSDFVGHDIIRIQDIIHADDFGTIAEEYRNLAQGTTTYKELLYRMKSSAGVWHWFAAQYQVMSYDETMPRYVLGLLHDITERHKAEEQRLALEIERERVELLTDFVRDASHGFRTPLATINTSVYLMRRINDPESNDQHLTLIKEQVEILDRLVEALLTMSRLDSGIALTFAPVDLIGLLHEIHHDIRDNYVDGLTFTLELDEQIPSIPGDKFWLYKALYELVQNAAQHANSHIHIKAWSQDEDTNVSIAIQDDGEGVPEHELGRIFERFYRGERSRLRGGLGLGLAIARMVVAEHHGEINVESKPYGGCAFIVSLPCAEL